jgi:CO/xanthine dehydrogenase Mo-binding subunit
MVDEFGQDLKVIGRPENLEYWIEHIVTGKLDYAADHPMPGMLFSRILCSTKAHAQVTSIDTSKAEALEGVEAVVTYEEHPLWSDSIVYWGAPIAAVAAVDEATAARALGLIDVVYDERPAVFDPLEAAQDGAPLVGIWPDTNTRTANEVERGDIDGATGFAAADVTIEIDTGPSAYHQHNLIEPDSAIAWWIGDDVYMWYKTQNPYSGRNSAAGALGVAQNKCHLYHHASGAGYGSAGGSNNHITAAVLSRKVGGRPVLMHQTRFETLMHNAHQYESWGHFKIGAKDDGTLTAIDATIWGDCGVSSWAPVSGATQTMQWTYDCPNGNFKNIRILTNTPGCGYWRCVQDPPGQYNWNQAMDEMANALGMNTLEFRLKNLRTQDKPQNDSTRPIASMPTKQMFETLGTMIDFNAKWHAPGTRTLPDGRMHGIAVAGHIDGHGGPSGRRGGTVQLNRDGTCYFNDGIARNHPTYVAHAHIIAETLGCRYDQVMIGALGDIDACSDGGMQAGSTCTISQGSALMVAAQDARDQVFERARELLEVAPGTELEAAEGEIWVKADVGTRRHNPSSAVVFAGTKT